MSKLDKKSEPYKLRKEKLATARIKTNKSLLLIYNKSNRPIR